MSSTWEIVTRPLTRKFTITTSSPEFHLWLQTGWPIEVPAEHSDGIYQRLWSESVRRTLVRLGFLNQGQTDITMITRVGLFDL